MKNIIIDCTRDTEHKFYLSINVFKNELYICKKCSNCKYCHVMKDTSFAHHAIPYISETYSTGNVIDCKSKIGCERHSLTNQICIDCQVKESIDMLMNMLDYD